jgi:carbonic anhydrase
MTKMCDEVLAANEAYAKNFGGKAKLPMPPARRFAILTCMDARLDPTKFAGLSEGDAHVIRNAGGRASGSLTSCSAPGSGSLSTTPIAAWRPSPTTSSTIDGR